MNLRHCTGPGGLELSPSVNHYIADTDTAPDPADPIQLIPPAQPLHVLESIQLFVAT